MADDNENSELSVKIQRFQKHKIADMAHLCTPESKLYVNEFELNERYILSNYRDCKIIDRTAQEEETVGQQLLSPSFAFHLLSTRPQRARHHSGHNRARIFTVSPQR